MADRLAPLEAPFSPDVEKTLEALMPPGVPPLLLFRTIAHNPRVLAKIRAGNLLDRGSIERRDRELVILRTCARCGSEYEWGVHVSVFARRFGLSEEEIASNQMMAPENLARDLTIGTAGEVIDRIKRYEDLGYDEFSFWIDSGMSTERKRASLSRFIDEVMPAFG